MKVLPKSYKTLVICTDLKKEKKEKKRNTFLKYLPLLCMDILHKIPNT